MRPLGLAALLGLLAIGLAGGSAPTPAPQAEVWAPEVHPPMTSWPHSILELRENPHACDLGCGVPAGMSPDDVVAKLCEGIPHPETNCSSYGLFSGMASKACYPVLPGRGRADYWLPDGTPCSNHHAVGEGPRLSDPAAWADKPWCEMGDLACLFAEPCMTCGEWPDSWRDSVDVPDLPARS